MKNDHFVIENMSPCLDGGRYPVKGIVGQPCVVEADVFRNGHEVIRAVVLWRKRDEKKYHESPMEHVDNDRWRGEFPLDQNIRYQFTVAAWTDAYASWLSDFKKRVQAGQNVVTETEEGAKLIEGCLKKAGKKESSLLASAAKNLRSAAEDPGKALQTAADKTLNSLMTKLQNRADLVQAAPDLSIIADRPLAVFGSWYEVFVRSLGEPGRHATFREAEKRLPEIKKMGFNVLYLAPIHPIGLMARKGPNNSLECGPNGPGCPWAVGNKNGGHTAIEPALGTLDDFDHFVKTARANGFEIALDFAVQCSPDHPWVKEHPEWFFHRPDGSIKCAENPPMKYEDICQVNFDCPNWKDLWQELKNVVMFWIDRGVRIFRVDNPHTKPTSFWEWFIDSVQEKYPDVIFLSESMTRPKPMKVLSKAGFTQSYTYFVWKNSKSELMEYLAELTTTDMTKYYRPNFFPTTPDNIHGTLQKGGRPAFKTRLALAATASPSYGIISGYELCENEAIPGTEEYKNSEKFEIPKRDWNKPGHIKDFIAVINDIRNRNSALHALDNLTFFDVDNDQIIAYGKRSKDGSNTIFVIVNLDPFHIQSGTVRIPLEKYGIPIGSRFEVKDLMAGSQYFWGERNFVKLDPQTEPYHILRLESIHS